MSRKGKFVTKSAASNIITRWYKRWTVPTIITIVVTVCYYPTFWTCFSRSLPFHGSSIHITVPMDNQDNQAPLPMEEILHQLIGSLFHYLQGFIHPRWCSISSINSRLELLPCQSNKKSCDFVLTLSQATISLKRFPQSWVSLNLNMARNGAVWYRGHWMPPILEGSKKAANAWEFWVDFPFRMHSLSWCHNTMTPVNCFNEFLFGFEVQRATNALFASQQFHNAPRERVVGRLNVAPSLMACQPIPPITCPPRNTVLLRAY